MTDWRNQVRIQSGKTVDGLIAPVRWVSSDEMRELYPEPREYQGPPQPMFCTRYGYRFEAAPMQAYCPHCGWARTEEYGHLPGSQRERWVVTQRAVEHRRQY